MYKGLPSSSVQNKVRKRGQSLVVKYEIVYGAAERQSLEAVTFGGGDRTIP